MGGGEGAVVLSAGQVGGTRDSGIVSSAANMLGMSVVRGLRGIGGVCNGRRGEWMKGLGLIFTITVGIGGVLDVCLRLGCGDVCGGW